MQTLRTAIKFVNNHFRSTQYAIINRFASNYHQYNQYSQNNHGNIPYISICPGIYGIANSDDINPYKRKRNYSSLFLNKPKESDSNENDSGLQIASSPPKKKRKKYAFFGSCYTTFFRVRMRR